MLAGHLTESQADCSFKPSTQANYRCYQYTLQEAFSSLNRTIYFIFWWDFFSPQRNKLSKLDTLKILTIFIARIKTTKFSEAFGDS